MDKDQKKEQKREQKKEQRKDKKPQGEGKAAPKRPLTEEEKNTQARVEKIEKQITDLYARFKEIVGKIHEKDNACRQLIQKKRDEHEAIKGIAKKIDEKRKEQNKNFSQAQKYIESLRHRKSRRTDERAELMKLLPTGSQLPSLRESEEDASGAVNDYDRAIKIVRDEIERIQYEHATNSSSRDQKVIGQVAKWNAVIEKIKELETKASAPLAELAEVDVLGCLETCRKLKGEIKELEDSFAPHYAAIAEAQKKIEDLYAEVPKLVKSRDDVCAEMKDAVGRLNVALADKDKATYKAIRAHNDKRRAEALQQSATIKARREEQRKSREARIEKAMNTLPHEREVAIAQQLLTYFRSIALPGTCGVSESARQPAEPKQKTKPTMTSAPSVELEEAVASATKMVVSRKSQPAPKVAKKQNKKKKAAAPAAAAPVETAPKKKTAEDSVRIFPVAAHQCEELSLNVPETYGEVEATYNTVKEKLEGYEKVRAMIKEQREKELKEAEQKAEEDAAKKEAEKAKAKAEAEKAKEAEKPAEAEAEKPAETEAEKPAEAEAEKPAEAEAEKPAEAEAEKPAEAEAEKPAEGEAEKPAEAESQ